MQHLWLPGHPAPLVADSDGHTPQDGQDELQYIMSRSTLIDTAVIAESLDYATSRIDAMESSTEAEVLCQSWKETSLNVLQGFCRATTCSDYRCR